jgi:hypothetical protein
VKKEKQYYVVGISEAAKDEHKRTIVRTEQVGDVPCQGGLKCNRIFIEFAKASREMNNGTEERSEVLRLMNSDMDIIKKELDGFWGQLVEEKTHEGHTLLG